MGIFFRHPVLVVTEHVQFQERANWNWSGRWVQHGGLLTITERRLICSPNRVDVGGEQIEAELGQISCAQVLEAGFAAARERGLGALYYRQVRLDITGESRGLVVKVADPNELLKALNLHV